MLQLILYTKKFINYSSKLRTPFWCILPLRSVQLYTWLVGLKMANQYPNGKSGSYEVLKLCEEEYLIVHLQV